MSSVLTLMPVCERFEVDYVSVTGVAMNVFVLDDPTNKTISYYQ